MFFFFCGDLRKDYELYSCNYFQLKDENGKLAGVDASDLLVANSGNDLPVRLSYYGGVLNYFTYCIVLYA